MSFIYSILTTPTNQAKTFSLNADGQLVKSSIANPTKGTFSTHSVETIGAFARDLNNITTKQTIILGQPHRPDGTPLQVGEKIGLTIKAKPSESSIPRSKDYIKNVNHAGFMLFDLDGNEFVLDDLKRFIPELQGVGAVIKPSSSSFIYDKNGKELIGNKGRHIYIPVSDLSDVPRIAAIFWDRMWLAGYGFYLISNGIYPMLLERGLFDKSVLGACERLAFEAAPILNDGLVQYNNHAVIVDGGILNTKLIVELSADDLENVKTLKEQAKAKVRPEYKAVITKKKSEFLATGKTEKDWESIKRRELPLNFELHTTQGIFKAEDLNKSHDGLTMADPNEPDYDGGNKTKAKFFWNDGKPKINSNAHGGIVYTIESLNKYDEDEEAYNWKNKLQEHVERMNQAHAQVVYGGKHRIIRFSADKYELFAQKELELLYQNKLIKTGERETKYGVVDIYDNHIAAWAKHRLSKIYSNGVVFQPNGAVDDGYFNTWRGFAVTPKKPRNADVLERIYCHIEQVICGNDYRLIEYFYNWIAYTFQYPDRPAGAALVLRGEKGTGKGTIGHFLREIWGFHGSYITNSKHLVGNFNGHLADTCFLFADEAFFSGDKQGENILKAIITDDVRMNEHKGLNAVMSKNMLKLFMATNSDYSVPATKDERRFCVIDVLNIKRGNKRYFDELHKDIKSKTVQEAFLYEMLNRNITAFHTGQIPETQALKDQRLYTLGSVGKWLVDCLTSGVFEISDTDSQSWTSIMSARDLFRSYLYWCDNQRIGEHHRVTQTKFGRQLNDFGFIVSHKTSGNIYRQMLDHDAAIALFERNELVTIPKCSTVPKLSLVQ